MLGAFFCFSGICLIANKDDVHPRWSARSGKLTFFFHKVTRGKIRQIGVNICEIVHLFLTVWEISEELSLLSCCLHCYSTLVGSKELIFVPLMLSSHGCSYQPPSELMMYISWQLVPAEDALLLWL